MEFPVPARGDAPRYWALVGFAGLVTLAGLVAAHYMEEHGHIVTGMNNQIVWGMPHVFAIFMIVGASGVLNMASVGSVFGQPAYKGMGARAGYTLLTGLFIGLGGMLGYVSYIVELIPRFSRTGVW